MDLYQEFKQPNVLYQILNTSTVPERAERERRRLDTAPYPYVIPGILDSRARESLQVHQGPAQPRIIRITDGDEMRRMLLADLLRTPDSFWNSEGAFDTQAMVAQDLSSESQKFQALRSILNANWSGEQYAMQRNDSERSYKQPVITPATVERHSFAASPATPSPSSCDTWKKIRMEEEPPILFGDVSRSSPHIPHLIDQQEEETMSDFRERLTHWIQQMMFVSGETAEASTETTWMIEEIVREQVLEMLKEATVLANRRGSKSISIVDLIFQIRHNPAKVSRLKTFLSWKDVRKNVKDSDDKAGGADADALDLEDAAGPGANPSAPQKSSTNKKAKLILPWEVQSFYSEQVPEREDEEDEEEEEQNEATLSRLASADERTRNMTREEYVYWSECRQASFTFRKGKRFREWAGFGTVIDSKPNDDVVDILGFLTFEIVQTLTEEALKVKNAEDLRNKKASIGRGEEASKKRKREGCTLFEMPEEGRTPVEPRHVREAFRILQIVPSKYKFMRQGYAGIRTPLRMI